MTVTALEASLRAIADALRRHRARWALVGGLAVSVHAEPRLTRDADVAVSVADDAEAERLVAALGADGYRVAATVDHEPTGRLATVRLVRAVAPELVTDLLFASSGIEDQVVGGAELVEVLPGLTLPVASAAHLVAMKVLARDDRQRPADADDLRRLGEGMTVAQWEQALAAAEAISARGFDRGRDVVGGVRALAADNGVALA